MSQSTWKSQSGYVWSLIGSAVGFANVLSFSAHAYKNGGGAFLIPYAIALFLLGIPFLVLEGNVGKRWKAPLVGCYKVIWGSWGKILGWLAVIACLTIGGFYIVLTGYSIAYTYFSFAGSIPEDTKAFFLQNFLKSSSRISDFGSLSIPIFLSALLVSFFTWFVLVKGIRNGIEKVCSIFMPILLTIITFFAVVVCFLPGGIDGLIFYLKPNFSKLASIALWRDIFGQLFFSLSLGLGIVVGYSRHVDQRFNISKAMIYTAIGDFVVSFISGTAIFGCLAYVSHVQGIPFNSLLENGSTFEIGFIVFPKILQLFGSDLSRVFGVIFFSCIFIAGITGVFSIVESICGNIEEEFQISRKKAVSLSVLLLVLLSFFFCMGNGTLLIDSLAPMVLGINMLIGGLAEIFAFTYFCKDRQLTAGLYKYQYQLKFLAVLILGSILLANIWNESSGFSTEKIVRWSWFCLSLFAAKALIWLANKRQAQVCKEIAA